MHDKSKGTQFFRNNMVHQRVTELTFRSERTLTQLADEFKVNEAIRTMALDQVLPANISVPILGIVQVLQS